MFEQILWPLLLVYAYYALGCTWWVTAGVWAHSPCTIYIFKPFSAYQEAEEILWLQNGCLTFKSYHMPHEILSHGQGRTCLLALLRGNRDVWQSTYQKKSLPKEIPINQGGKKYNTKKPREKKKMTLIQENYDRIKDYLWWWMLKWRCLPGEWCFPDIWSHFIHLFQGLVLSHW